MQQRGLSFLRKKTRPDQGAARNRRSRYPGDGDGFLLLYKRLDNGVFRWPRTETEALLLTEQQVRWLTEGLEIEQPKAIKPGKPGLFY
ncbi:MAG: transposase [Ruminococcaceae bacterium]|nr:transposase [Oscillospiraceae bacterium]